MRKSGILLHLSSLPSPFGIGTMGKKAYEFVDFAKLSGQKLWQVLPIGQTSYGNSPYQSYSSYAGNPYFIDLDTLVDLGYLEKSDLPKVGCEDRERVDYGYLFETRLPILKKAVRKFLEKPDIAFYDFAEKNSYWLDDYSHFMALKEKMNFIGREEWPLGLRHKCDEAVAFCDCETVREYKVIQFFFFSQWYALKQYANENGIEIIGDLPIYCASDSSDVWGDVDAYLLDDEYLPTKVSGVPPDGFSPYGQRWGNPIYDWKYLAENDFYAWVKRLKYALEVFDTVRIDHFRGFDSYYEIDAKAETAVDGKWAEGPGMKLFETFDEKIGDNLPIIAEDLGFLTESVKELLEKSGYPGMKLLQFAFDDREAGDYLPHNYTKNSVCYIGTHDNDTALGWFISCDEKTQKKAERYLNFSGAREASGALIRSALASVSDYAVICMQDWLGLGSEARMNTPSTDSGNWEWRLEEGALSDELAKKIRDMTELYGR